ncbi:MAG: hypothetical protein ACSHW7_09515 [Patiriisocius sp.]|uniref:hypothetical protein n=1 Tax=Patiriisocius sp. TaxID=2822396 RepID=UPI003EFA8F92
MKSIITFLLFFICGITAIRAQDTIIKTNQEEIEAKVIEITDSTIKYKIWLRQEGPIYNINKDEVFMILYASGDKEYYTDKKKDAKTEETVNSLKKPEQMKNQNYNTNSTVSSNKQNSGNKEAFNYRDGAKVNYGFGYDAGAGDGVISIGLFAPYSFSSDSQGSIEIEIGGTFVFYNGLGIGGSNNTSIYNFSVSGGYGFYIFDSFKVSAGLGYYIGFGNTRFNSTTDSFTINDIYYHTGAEYWFTNGFGMNLRYDAIMGPSVGILFLNF